MKTKSVKRPYRIKEQVQTGRVKDDIRPSELKLHYNYLKTGREYMFIKITNGEYFTSVNVSKDMIGVVTNTEENPEDSGRLSFPETPENAVKFASSLVDDYYLTPSNSECLLYFLPYKKSAYEALCKHTISKMTA